MDCHDGRVMGGDRGEHIDSPVSLAAADLCDFEHVAFVAPSSNAPDKIAVHGLTVGFEKLYDCTTRRPPNADHEAANMGSSIPRQCGQPSNRTKSLQS